MARTSFAELLRKRSPGLSTQLDEIRQRALEEWIHYLTPDHGSHSGYVHLCGVERNADKMIPDAAKEKFSDGEIFLLLSSILLHDLGRILPDRVKRVSKDCPFAPDPKCCTPPLGPSAPEPCLLGEEMAKCSVNGRNDHPGKTHACRSKWLISEHWPIFGLPDSHIAEHCARIAFWHQLDAPPEPGEKLCTPADNYSRYFCDTSLEPYGHLRIPLLAAILRLADEAENSWTRAFRRHWYEILTREPASGSGHYVDERNLGKAFRKGIEDVEFVPEGECLVLYIPAASGPPTLNVNEEILAQLAVTAGDTCEALEKWGDLLALADASYRYVFIDRGGELWRASPCIGNPKQSPVKLSTKTSLSLAFEAIPQSGNKEIFLESGSLERYSKGIYRLVKGTRGYQRFSWSAVEGAIGEPLTPRIKWAIERIGRPPSPLTIVTHRGSNELTISRKSANGIDKLHDYLGIHQNVRTVQ